MALYRVRTALTGNAVAGGGVATHYFGTGAGTAQQAATAVATFWVAVEPWASDQLTWTTDAQVDLFDETTQTITGSTAVTNATGVGDSSSERLPEATQLLLQLRTGAFPAGREVRGRLFIPGMVEANSSNGTPVGGMVSAINSAAAALIASSNTQWVVNSPTRFTAYEVTSSNCWADEFAVLRSRRD